MKEFIGEKLAKNKIFGWILTIIATFGLCCTTFQIVTYEWAVRPYLFELPAWILEKYPTALPLFPAFTTNNVSGANNLAYFTVLSNIITDLYLLALGLSIIGVKFAKKFGFNKYYGGATTMFIGITGIVYCTIMFPFLDKSTTSWVYEFPALAMLDFLGYWHHMVLPVIMIVVWMLPFSNEKLDKKKFAKISLFFPVVYSVFTVIRGFCGGLYPIDSSLVATQTWFPYPFLSPDRIGPYVSMLIGGTPSEAVNIVFTVICYLLCAFIFAITPKLIVKLHNKQIDKLNAKYKFCNCTID